MINRVFQLVVLLVGMIVDALIDSLERRRHGKGFA